MLFVAFLGLA